MKKIILLLLIAILIVGCESEESLEGQDTTTTTDSTAKTTTPTKTSAPKEPSIVTEGNIEIKGNTQTSLIVVDSPVDIGLTIDGEASYKINEQNIVTGSGSGNVEVNLKSDIGIAKCSSSETIPITFELKGTFDKSTNKLSYQSSNVNPSKTVTVLDCPSDYGDMTYDLDLPIQAFMGGETDFVFDYTDGSLLTKQLSHPIEGWDTSVPVDWNIKILFSSEFDFDVDVDPAIVTIQQGAAATPLITTRLVRGTAKDVDLTVTNWPKITASITNPTVTPTETTTLTIETDCDTPVDNYLFTVTGSTSDTFKTSVDSVNVYVEKNPSCP